MVKKTYQLKPEDQEYLISLACRYRSIQTRVDEIHGFLYVDTTFADNEEPTSSAARFGLICVSEKPPVMPEGEYRRRVMGRP